MSRRFAAHSSAPAGEARHFFLLLWRPASAAWLAGWLLCLLAGLLYFATLDTGLLQRELEGGDLITHQYAQVQARPSNAPGYPLYTMGGWLWFHGWRSLLRLFGHPLPNPLPILGGYSMFWALIALGLFYRILLHLSYSPRRPAGHWSLAWLITAFYAVTYFFWYYATTTEQYSSAVAHTLAILYVYLLWDEARGREGKRRRRGEGRATRYLLLLAFLCGLSLAHMVTVAMIVPPLVAVVLWTEPRLLRRPLTVLGAVLAAALPLVSYIYVYLRGAAHPEWWGQGEWATAKDWFWSFVRTSQGQDELSWGLRPGAPFFGNGFPELIWQELSVPLLVLGLIGIACLGLPLRLSGNEKPALPASGLRLVCLLYATLLLYLGLCWVDRFGNWFQVILPAYPLILLGLLPIGLWLETRFTRGREQGELRLGARPSNPLRAGLARLPQVLMLAAILWRIDASWPAVDSRHRPEDTALIRPALLLDQPLPEDAALFAEKDDALGLDYLINIWGIRPDLQVVSSPEASALLDAGGVVLTPWAAAPLLRSELRVAGPLALWAQTPDWVALQRGDSVAVAAPAVRLDLAAGDGIRLLGYTSHTGPKGEPVLAEAALSFDLYLYWQVVPGGTPSNWSISVRPLRNGMQVMGTDGTPIQHDSPGPVHGLRPFGEIDAGKMIVDAYRLPGGTAWDEIQVVLYRSVDEGFENLAVLNFPFAP